MKKDLHTHVDNSGA